MAIIDMVGVPLPLEHPKFKDDYKLIKRVRKLESLIELRADMEDANWALSALRHSLKKENDQTITQVFKCIPFQISEFILSHIIVLYAKAFTKSTGRTRLNDQIKVIFKTDIDKHKTLMNLRHSFYAHQRIEANRHQIFCLPNNPVTGKVKLNPDAQIKRILMAKTIKLEIIEFCISQVTMYLQVSIENLCNIRFIRLMRTFSRVWPEFSV